MPIVDQSGDAVAEWMMESMHELFPDDRFNALTYEVSALRVSIEPPEGVTHRQSDRRTRPTFSLRNLDTDDN